MDCDNLVFVVHISNLSTREVEIDIGLRFSGLVYLVRFRPHFKTTNTQIESVE